MRTFAYNVVFHLGHISIFFKKHCSNIVTYSSIYSNSNCSNTNFHTQQEDYFRRMFSSKYLVRLPEYHSIYNALLYIYIYIYIPSCRIIYEYFGVPRASDDRIQETNNSFETLSMLFNTGCYKNSFTTLKEDTDLYRGHTQCHFPRNVNLQSVTLTSTKVVVIVAGAREMRSYPH
jgi:hypothetical protein